MGEDLNMQFIFCLCLTVLLSKGTTGLRCKQCEYNSAEGGDLSCKNNPDSATSVQCDGKCALLSGKTADGLEYVKRECDADCYTSKIDYAKQGYKTTCCSTDDCNSGVGFLAGFESGLTCKQCQYGFSTEGGNIDCLNHPDRVPSVPCDGECALVRGTSEDGVEAIARGCADNCEKDSPAPIRPTKGYKAYCCKDRNDCNSALLLTAHSSFILLVVAVVLLRT